MDWLGTMIALTVLQSELLLFSAVFCWFLLLFSCFFVIIQIVLTKKQDTTYGRLRFLKPKCSRIKSNTQSKPCPWEFVFVLSV